VPLGGGKLAFDAARRAFLKLTGGAVAGTVAAKSGLFGLLKGSKSAVVKDLTSIPIEQVGAGYMPPWFKPLVNKVIKEGDDVTKKFATKEREIVHTKKLDDFEEVTVHQNLDEGTIEVSYKTPNSMAEAGVDFKYTAPQKMVTKKGPVKTEPTFEAVESYPESHVIGPDDAEITFEGENVVGMVDNLFSDTSKLKQYATGKKLTKLEQKVAKKKIDRVTEINNDPSAQSDLLPDYDPYASGGRVPLREAGEVMEMDEWYEDPDELEEILKAIKQRIKEGLGKYQTGGRVPFKGGGKGALLEGLAKLFDEFFPGTTKFGKTSKPLAEKTQLRRAIADFQEREKVVIDGKKYKLSDKDRPPTKDELENDYAELWDDENSPLDFGSTIRELDAELANRAEEYKYMYQQYKMGKLEPKAGEVNRGRLKLLRERSDEAGMSGDQKLFSRDEMDELDVLEDHFAQVDKEEAFRFAEEKRIRKEKAGANKESPWFKDPKTLTPEEELRREFPGIDDRLIKNILADKNPQRIAEVKQTMREALKMQQKGMSHEEIINIFKKKPTKHASGGRVPMWLGGGLTKGKRTVSELLKFMSKDSSHGKTPSEMLNMINPKQFNQMLDRPEGIPSIAKEMIEKYTKEMKIDRASMIQDLIGTGRRIKKVDDDLIKYKIKIVEDMVSKGVDRKTAVQMADKIAEMASSAAGKKATPKITDQGLLEMENIQKNLATKDRKLNASGGRVSLSSGGVAGMLGE
jgi:hypothetical protein